MLTWPLCISFISMLLLGGVNFGKEPSASTVFPDDNETEKEGLNDDGDNASIEHPDDEKRSIEEGINRKRRG